MSRSRRQFLEIFSSLPFLSVPLMAFAQADEIWSATQAHDALAIDAIRLLDIRSRDEWRDTGVAVGAWLISMHESGFAERLFTARELAAGRTVAIICATGGRTRSVMQGLKRAGYTGFADVSEGMLGSSSGPGWIAAGLPLVSMEQALGKMPPDLL